MRKQAAFALGLSPDSDSLSELQRLYGLVESKDLKMQILYAASLNRNKEEAVNFLIDVTKNDESAQAKKQALFGLSHTGGERSFKILKEVLESADGQTEIQKQAVFALSRMDKEKAVPLLAATAKSHPKAEVRSDAIFWLGQVAGQGAVKLLK